MIVDELVHAHFYRALGPGFAAAFDYLARVMESTPQPGRYPLDGEHLVANVDAYRTKSRAEGRWEAHRRYADIHVVLRGEERFGFAPISSLRADEYDADRDLTWLEGDGTFLTLAPGSFVIALPQDGHMPGIAVTAPTDVLKVVMKIAV